MNTGIRVLIVEDEYLTINSIRELLVKYIHQSKLELIGLNKLY